jgi:DNA-binding MarR family transcriptional regulator
VAISADDLYGSLEEFVTRLMNLAESDSMDALVDLDLSFSQARTVFLLAKTAEPMPIHAIAEALGLSVAATGRNVDQLVQLEVVERRESPSDRRVKLISLTVAGKHLAARHTDAKRASLRSFVDALPADKCHQLHHALTDILAGDNLPPRKDQENCL